MTAWRRGLVTDDDLSGLPPLDGHARWQRTGPAVPGMAGARRPGPGRAFPRRAIAAGERALAAIIARAGAVEP